MTLLIRDPSGYENTRLGVFLLNSDDVSRTLRTLEETHDFSLSIKPGDEKDTAIPIHYIACYPRDTRPDKNVILILHNPNAKGRCSYVKLATSDNDARWLILEQFDKLSYPRSSDGSTIQLPTVYLKLIPKHNNITESVKRLIKQLEGKTFVENTDTISTHTPKQGEYLGKDENKAESIYCHPYHQTTYDTYLSISAGVKPQQGVHLGKWCAVREILSDGTVITTEGDKLTPAITAYVDYVRRVAVEMGHAASPVTLYVMAINSKDPIMEVPKPEPMTYYQPYDHNRFGNNF
ncbi:hypothetical protein HH607_005496 [Escherichia coli]|nr:hypothetical protein [Escherichia coli]